MGSDIGETSGNYDFGLVGEFLSIDDFEAYENSAAHQACLSLLSSILASSAKVNPLPLIGSLCDLVNLSWCLWACFSTRSNSPSTLPNKVVHVTYAHAIGVCTLRCGWSISRQTSQSALSGQFPSTVFGFYQRTCDVMEFMGVILNFPRSLKTFTGISSAEQFAFQPPQAVFNFRVGS